MSGPWDEIAEALATGAALLEDPISGLNIYATAPAAISVPCLVVRPDEPWREESDDEPMTRKRERYLVLAVASASDGAGAIDLIYRLIRLAESIEGGRIAWRSSSAPVRLIDGGVTYIGASVHLTFSEGR